MDLITTEETLVERSQSTCFKHLIPIITAATLLIASLFVLLTPSLVSAWSSDDGAVSIHAPSTSAGSVHGVAVDSSGNIYACGYYRGNFDVDPDPDTTVLLDGAGLNQPVVSKYNTSGNLVWARLLDADVNGIVNDCAISSDEAYIAVTGDYKGTMDVDGAGSMATITSGSEWDAYVALINASTGAVVWVKGLGGEEKVEGMGVDFGPGNEVYVAGRMRGSVDINFDAGTTTTWESDGLESWLTKISVGGTVEWAHAWGDSSSDQVFDVAVDRDNHHVYIGGFASTLSGGRDWDPDPDDEVLIMTETGVGHQSVIARYDSTGDLVWAKSFGSNGHDRINDLAAKGGFVYATGWQNGSTGDWDPSAGTIQLPGDTVDVFTLKMNSSAETQWAVSWGGTGLLIPLVRQSHWTLPETCTRQGISKEPPI